jgi:hypothetical protein
MEDSEEKRTATPTARIEWDFLAEIQVMVSFRMEEVMGLVLVSPA